MDDYYDESSLADYLYGRFPERGPFEVRRLTGGVSSLVFMARGMSGMRLVIKQSLERLAVAEEWLAPRERILTEAEAMTALASVLPEGSVPSVYFIQAAKFTYGMQAAPQDAVLFKSALMEGRWEEAWFDAAGEMLATLHRETSWRADEFGTRFADQTMLDVLRLDPYYRRAARAHPDLKEAFARAEKCAKSDARCLVHDDYSPKNIFVQPATGRLILLDYEGAHWGNPAFDVGFFLTHPLAKGIHFPNDAKRFAEAIRRFARAYFASCGSAGAKLEDAILQWGAISLARVDGKSPLEYLIAEPERHTLRQFGRKMLLGGFSTIEEIATELEAVV